MESDRWRGPILVAAPLTSLRTVWLREITRYTPDAHVAVAVPYRGSTGNAARTAIIQDWLNVVEIDKDEVMPHILIVNPEMLKDIKIGENEEDKTPIYAERFPLLNRVEWNVVILDESHRYLSGVRSTQDLTLQGEALLALKIRDGGLKVALSGTPMRGKPKNLWGTLHWLRPDRYTSFWRWAQQYLEISNNGYGST